MLSHPEGSAGEERPFCPKWLLMASMFCFGVIFMNIASLRHAIEIEDATSRLSLASVGAYHAAEQLHGMHGTPEQIDAGRMERLRGELEDLVTKLVTAHDGLAKLLSRQAPDFEAFREAPFRILSNATGLSGTSDQINAIWFRDHDGKRLSDLIREQLLMCTELCELSGQGDTNHQEHHSSHKASDFASVVVGTLMPELRSLQRAAAIRVEAIIERLLLVTGAMAFMVVTAVIMTRYWIVLPLVEQLSAANAKLGLRNNELERKVAERTSDLTHALARAEHAHEARTRFLASVNHEMRTPLNGVLGVAALMQKTDLTPVQSNYLDIISSSGATLIRLINDVLDVTTQNTGKMVLEEHPAKLNDLVRESLALLRPIAEEKDLELRMRLKGETEAMALVDSDRFTQILHNLTGNAIKFTSRGRVTVVLMQTVDGGRLNATLMVQDTGPGIPNDDRERIFSPFERAAAGEPTQGAGLGLAVTSSLVREMGGTIHLEDTPRGGTRFVVRLTFPYSMPSDAYEVSDVAA